MTDNIWDSSYGLIVLAPSMATTDIILRETQKQMNNMRACLATLTVRCVNNRKVKSPKGPTAHYHTLSPPAFDVHLCGVATWSAHAHCAALWPSGKRPSTSVTCGYGFMCGELHFAT